MGFLDELLDYIRTRGIAESGSQYGWGELGPVLERLGPLALELSPAGIAYSAGRRVMEEGRSPEFRRYPVSIEDALTRTMGGLPNAAQNVLDMLPMGGGELGPALGILIGPRSGLWKRLPQVGSAGEQVPRGAFSALWDRKSRVEIPDEQLFEAYPQLKAWKVEAGIDPHRVTSQGATRPGTWTIEASAPDEQSLLETVVHEWQHPVQDIEGWARGGSPEGLSGASLWSSEEADRYFQLYKKSKLTGDEALELQYLSKLPGERYKNLAGEMEARDAASRAGWTEAQRASVPIYSSEDIPLEDLIVNRGSGEALSTPTKEPPKVIMTDKGPRLQKDVDMETVDKLRRDMEQRRLRDALKESMKNR